MENPYPKATWETPGPFALVRVLLCNVAMLMCVELWQQLRAHDFAIVMTGAVIEGDSSHKLTAFSNE